MSVEWFCGEIEKFGLAIFFSGCFSGLENINFGRKNEIAKLMCFFGSLCEIAFRVEF